MSGSGRRSKTRVRMHPSGDVEVLAKGRTVHLPAHDESERTPPQRENPAPPWVAHIIRGDQEIAHVELRQGEEEHLLDAALDNYREADAVEIEGPGGGRVEIGELYGAMRAAHAHEIPLDFLVED